MTANPFWELKPDPIFYLTIRSLQRLSLAELGKEVNNNNLQPSREVWTAPVLMQVQQAMGFLVAE